MCCLVPEIEALLARKGVISSMGRWRMRLEVPRAEVAEMLPLARLLSRSTDPAVHSRSKVVLHFNVLELIIYHNNHLGVAW